MGRSRINKLNGSATNPAPGEPLHHIKLAIVIILNIASLSCYDSNKALVER